MYFLILSLTDLFLNVAATEDVLSCGGRLYKVNFVPDHPNITRFGTEEYRYLPLKELAGLDEPICHMRPANYYANDQTVLTVKNVRSHLIFTYCEECGRCDTYSHMALHRRVSNIATRAQLDSVLILTPKPSLSSRNIPSTVVKLVQLNTRYVLSRTCAIKHQAPKNAVESHQFLKTFLTLLALFVHSL